MDWPSWVVQLIAALTPLVTVLVVWGVRKVVPSIPRVALPVVALVLPLTVTWLTNYLSGHPTLDPITAALLGAAAVWLREVVNTLKEHGADA